METDYHDMCNKNTSIADRRFFRIGDIWINAAVCNKCKDYIRSKNRHDFVKCKCGESSVDGGSWYAKRVGDCISIIEPFNYIE